MSFWDVFAGLYDLVEWTNRKAYVGAVRQVQKWIPQWGTVLECAAGTGEYSLAAAEKAGAVICTDLSQAMLDRAARKAKRRGLTNITFLVRDLTHLPDGDGTYDVVIAANVLHLLPEPEKAVAELWRVTTPGGKLILPTFLQGEADFVARGMIRVYQWLGFQCEQKFTLGSYRKFLLARGLDIQISRVPGRLPVGLAVCEKPAGDLRI